MQPVESTPAAADVIVVGSYVQDLSWRCAAFPSPGQTTLGEFRTGPGGKGSNQAIAAGRAGARTRFVGAVGMDVFARGAMDFYRDNGIAANFISKPEHSTGTAAILVDSNGQNEIVVALGANDALFPSDLPAELFKEARVVVTQLEVNLAATEHTLRAGRAAGAMTVLNPAPMRDDFDFRLLELVDVLIPNESELVALVNRLDPSTSSGAFTLADLETAAPADLHKLCRRLGPPTVIVTLGARGCLISEPTGYQALSAHKVSAVDTTGAGDAFVGGFAAGLVLHSRDCQAAARLGQVVAALSVTKPGTAPSMPTATEIDAFDPLARTGTL